MVRIGMQAHLWHERALPILQFIAELESNVSVLDVGTIADGTGISPEHVWTELQRLIDGHLVAGTFKAYMSGDTKRGELVIHPRLTADGARAIGAWPSGNDFFTVLSELIEREPDTERKSKLQKLRTTVRDIAALQSSRKCSLRQQRKSAGCGRSRRYSRIS